MAVTLEAVAACVGAIDVFDQIADAPGKAPKGLLSKAAGLCEGCLLADSCPDFTPYPGFKTVRPAAAAMEQAILDHLAAADKQTATIADIVDAIGYDTGTVLRALARLRVAEVAHRSGRTIFTLTAQSASRP